MIKLKAFLSKVERVKGKGKKEELKDRIHDAFDSIIDLLSSRRDKILEMIDN